jgi:predicted transcriptional regulator
MDSRELTAFGLTEAESLIYMTILKLNKATVKDIAKECGFHRTNIYDVLEQLKEKGLVSSAAEGKAMRYRASDPNSLYALLEEKRELLDTLFPALQAFYTASPEETKVEVYKGNEGMKTTWRDMIKEGKPLFGYGVKGQLREKLPTFAAQWSRDAKAKNIPYYGIYTERGNPPVYASEVRYVSEELTSPVATFIYGDKVNINIWEPTLVAIVIKSELVAKMFKSHFDLMWRIAKK